MIRELERFTQPNIDSAEKTEHIRRSLYFEVYSIHNLDKVWLNK